MVEHTGLSLGYRNALHKTKAEVGSEKPFSSYGLVALALLLLLFIIVLSVFVNSKSRKQGVLLCLILVLALMLEQWLERYIVYRHQQDSRTEALQDLGVARANLESILNNNLSLLKGMSIAIAANPGMTEQQFNSYAQEVLRSESLLVNFAAAPDMVVRYIYPLKGNESVIGLDYLSHPKQRQEAIEVRDSRQIMVAGPLELVQGGQALIGRAPIYYYDQESKQERFWGIVSAPMKVEGVLHAAGLSSLIAEHELAIQKINVKNNSRVPVVGDQGLFEQHAVLADVYIGKELWQIAALPSLQSEQLSDSLLIVRLMFSFVVFLIAIILFVRLRQGRERRKFVSALQYRESMLEKVGIIAKVGGWEYRKGKGFSFWSTEVFNILNIQDRSRLPDEWTLYQKICPEYIQELKTKIKSALNQQQDFDIEIALNLEELGRKWVCIQAYADINSNGEAVIQGVIQDVTERKNSEAIILKQANYDPLTHLPNRSLFDARLGFTVASAARSQERFALLYIDLDRFKSINDSLGHNTGDQLLVEVADRFKQCIRESDTLSRRSGDEFTLIASQLPNSRSAELIARNILSQLKAPFAIENNQIYMSASIGITVYPDDGQEAEVLMKNADQAMYGAKSLGRNTFCYFTEAMQTEADRRLRLHMELTEALAEHQLKVFYQPIIDMQTGQVVECEALARWFHPELGEISPDEFIPLAEDVGLIHQLGEFVTSTALADLSKINKRFKLDIGLALNKSYREFFSGSDEPLAWFEQLLSDKDKPRVTLEITESMLMEDDTIYSTLDQLRQAGVKVAIDDFGTGYSSLSYLRRFPVDLLKIDRTFIRDIDIDREDLTLVEAILAMAKNLGLKVVAEGVETVEQMHLLETRYCDYAQGFYYSEPMAISQLSSWLAEAEAPVSTLAKDGFVEGS